MPADEEFDSIFEAEMAAQDACSDLVETMAKQLDALESGTLTQEQIIASANEMEDLFRTVRKKMEKVKL